MQSAPTSGGWRFSREERRWVFAEPALSTVPATFGRPLRLATLNCLHDQTLPEVLHHEVRHAAICRELRELEADVIGLNEVTRSLLERLLSEPWVRDSYTVSAVPDDERCSHVSAVLDGCFGNMLLSKVAPISVEYLGQPGDGRHAHVMTLGLCAPQSRTPLRLSVCSVHLTASPWLMEGRRQSQLRQHALALATEAGSGSVDASVLMGDFNFHREAENASIPEGWGEVPAVVEAGATWDYARNPMLAHYLPKRNLYNGLGLGQRFGWPSPMRLDRVLVRGLALDREAAEARLFADRPIHERARGRAALPYTGPELWESHRALPWEEYLCPSDHFGIVVSLPLARHHQPSPD